MIGVRHLFATGLLFLAASLVSADVSIDVYPAFAPTGPVSPNWGDYVNNSIVGIEAGGADQGSRNTSPGSWETVKSSVHAFDMVYTDFNSWRSFAAPSPEFAGFGSPFTNEFGNRIHFGMRAVSDGAWRFNLQQFEWSLDSTDGDDYFDQSGSFASLNYSSARVGIDYVDGIKGNGNDIVYDNGESGALNVDELLLTGVGDGFVSENLLIQDQDNIDAVLTSILTGCDGCEVELTGTYTLNHPSHAEPIIESGTVVIETTPGFGGDINRDGIIDCDDMDLLTAAVAGGNQSAFFDVNGDFIVNFGDVEHAVQSIHNTYFGDSNCDGEFNSSDLIQVFVSAKYETGDAAVWSEGDWNADGVFNSSDLILAFIDGGYEQGPIPAATVPEPSSIILTFLGFCCFAHRFRK